jgi:hypothetical protein
MVNKVFLVVRLGVCVFPGTVQSRVSSDSRTTFCPPPLQESLLYENGQARPGVVSGQVSVGNVKWMLFPGMDGVRTFRNQTESWAGSTNFQIIPTITVDLQLYSTLIAVLRSNADLNQLEHKVATV